MLCSWFSLGGLQKQLDSSILRLVQSRRHGHISFFQRLRGIALQGRSLSLEGGITVILFIE